MTTIADMRARLRKDLHDEDSANYRWTDGELDRHIQRAVRDFSLASPLEAKAALTTAPDSRDVSIASLTDVVGIEAVEYPTGKYPPAYIRYSVWLNTLTMLIDAVPPAALAGQRLLHEAPPHRRHVLHRPGPLRGRHRHRRRRLRRRRVVVVRDEPRQRRRPGRLAGLPHLGPGTPRRIPARAGEARAAERRAGAAVVHAVGDAVDADDSGGAVGSPGFSLSMV